METSFKWCPECTQYVTHLGVKCAGCDMDDEDIERVVERELNGKPPRPSGKSETTQEVQEEDQQGIQDPLENDWILCKEKEVVFGADSKEDCEEELGEEFSVIRYAKDLFFCKGPGVTYWIGRPEAFRESGMSIN